MTSIEQVRLFEKEWRCSLPKDFVEYIEKNGFIKGILPIDYWFDAFQNDAAVEGIVDWLVEPCPLVPGQKLYQAKDEEYQSIDTTPLPGETAFQTEMRLWGARAKIWRKWMKDLQYKIDPFQGTISIVSLGCTFYDLLVVTGPAHGRIISMDADYDVPFFHKAANFAEYITSKR